MDANQLVATDHALRAMSAATGRVLGSKFEVC